MTVQSRDYLKAKFQTRDVPVEQDYIDLIDTFVSLDGSNQSLGGAISVSGQFNFIATADSSVRASIGPNRAMFLSKVSAQGGVNTTIVSAETAYITSAVSQNHKVNAINAATIATITASGSTQGQANLITAPMVMVFNCSTGINDGVILPGSTTTGDTRVVFNRSSDNLKVYPESGARINVAATNAAYVVSGLAEPTTFYRSFATEWYTGR